MERQGSVLRVWRESGGLFSVGWLGGGAEKVTLTVPESLCHQSLDATLRIGSAGFKDVTADVGSGNLNLSGLADSVAADVGSGSVGMDIDGADRASVRVGSGELYAWFTQVPGTLSVDVGSGEARLSLPTGRYALTQDVAPGSWTTVWPTTPRGLRGGWTSPSDRAASPWLTRPATAEPRRWGQPVSQRRRAAADTRSPGVPAARA